MYRKRLIVDPVYQSSCKSQFPSCKTASSALGIYTFIGVNIVGFFFSLFFFCVRVTGMKHKFHSANPLLIGCGEPLTHDFLKSFQLFTIRIIYNDPVSVYLCEARTQNWHQMLTSVSSRLPPDHDSFQEHCLGAHLLVFERRNAMCIKSVIPFHFGWELRCGTLVPIMHNTPHALLHQRFRNSLHLWHLMNMLC